MAGLPAAPLGSGMLTGLPSAAALLFVCALEELRSSCHLARESALGCAGGNGGGNGGGGGASIAVATTAPRLASARHGCIRRGVLAERVHEHGRSGCKRGSLAFEGMLDVCKALPAAASSPHSDV